MQIGWTYAVSFNPLSFLQGLGHSLRMAPGDRPHTCHASCSWVRPLPGLLSFLAMTAAAGPFPALHCCLPHITTDLSGPGLLCLYLLPNAGVLGPSAALLPPPGLACSHAASCIHYLLMPGAVSSALVPCLSVPRGPLAAGNLATLDANAASLSSVSRSSVRGYARPIRW